MASSGCDHSRHVDRGVIDVDRQLRKKFQELLACASVRRPRRSATSRTLATSAARLPGRRLIVTEPVQYRVLAWLLRLRSTTSGPHSCQLRTELTPTFFDHLAQRSAIKPHADAAFRRAAMTTRCRSRANRTSRATSRPCLVIVTVSPRSTWSSRRGRWVLAS